MQVVSQEVKSSPRKDRRPLLRSGLARMTGFYFRSSCRTSNNSDYNTRSDKQYPSYRLSNCSRHLCRYWNTNGKRLHFWPRCFWRFWALIARHCRDSCLYWGQRLICTWQTTTYRWDFFAKANRRFWLQIDSWGHSFWHRVGIKWIHSKRGICFT